MIISMSVEFKMIFDTTKHRYNSVENFEQRGLSWHGSLVFYSVQVYFEPDLYETRQQTMYIDHINKFNK